MVGSLKEIVGSLQEFILLCDQRRGNNTISRIKIDLFNLNREGAQPTF